MHFISASTVLILTVVFFLDPSSSQEGPTIVTSEVVKFVGKTADKEFYVVSDKLILGEGSAACRSAGLVLAEIDSKSENDLLKNSPTLVNGEYYWTDGVAISQFDSCIWETIGKKVDNSLSPIAGNRSFTVQGMTFRAGPNYGTWDVDYTYTYPLPQPIHSALCQSRTGLGQIRLARLGQIKGKTFYVESNLTMNWAEALEYCDNYGLKLAAIETKEEQEFLLNSDLLTYYTKYWTSGRVHLTLPYFKWRRTMKPVDGAIANFNPDVDVEAIAFVGKGSHWHRYPLEHRYNVLCQIMSNEK